MNTLYVFTWFKNVCLRNRLTDIEKKKKKPYGYQRRKGWEFGISRNMPLYIKYISNKVLLYSIGNYIQYPVINHSRKEYEKECVYICITESLGCIPEANTTLQVNYTSMKVNKAIKDI